MSKNENIHEKLEKINREILKQFDSYIEWLSYYDKMYPFWKNNVEGYTGGEGDYKKWFGGIAEQIRLGTKLIDNGAPKKNKPKINFDFSEYRDPIVKKS